MLFWTTVKIGLQSLWANKTRSFLAMLGVIIGVAAVIAMLAIGTGAKRQVLTRIAAMGTNLLIVTPGQSGSHGVTSGTQQNLVLADALALLETEGVHRLAPVVQGRAQVKYANKNQPTQVTGTTPSYFFIRDYTIAQGRRFSDTEADSMSHVAVIGPVTAENLFGRNDPLGQAIKVKGISFTVVGVTAAKGDQGFFNPDDQVFVPYSTAMKQLFGLTYLREVDVQAVPEANLTKVQEALAAVIRKRHRCELRGGDDDFNVRNQADFVQMATQVTETFTFLLASTASISLLVGGIGIMNIMLVTVTERTREIGVRKAIGATESSILRQFLLESVIISGFGGLLGVVLGTGTALLLPKLTPFTTAVELPAVIVALLFSAAVGVFFGWYPARRAAQLDPVEALRYE